MRYAIALIAALALAGCAATTAGISCPPLIEYSAAEQARAAQELDAAGPTVQRMVDDYGKTRDAIRACERRRAAE